MCVCLCMDRRKSHYIVFRHDFAVVLKYNAHLFSHIYNSLNNTVDMLIHLNFDVNQLLAFNAFIHKDNMVGMTHYSWFGVYTSMYMRCTWS